MTENTEDVLLARIPVNAATLFRRATLHHDVRTAHELYVRALEVVDVAAADADRFVLPAIASCQLQRTRESQMDFRRAPPAAQPVKLFLDAERERARREEVEQGALGIGGGEDDGRVDRLAGREGDSGDLPLLDADALHFSAGAQ